MAGKMKSTDVVRELEAVSTPARAAGASRFFKTGPGEYGEGDLILGVTVPDTRKIALKYRTMDTVEVTRLLKHPGHECRLAALLILVEQSKRGDEQVQREVLNTYLANTRYVNNWDLVDVSSRDIVGPHLRRSPELLTTLARSKSLWERRIAIISTMAMLREREADEVLRISEMLLGDKHDLIHKAVGWALREVGRVDRQALLRFLETHYSCMPRTALRYAIEHFPAPTRAKLLRGDFQSPAGAPSASNAASTSAGSGRTRKSA
jgi:3-methyladenine DNA glycosylase AlkD